ncbi:MAG: diversity-generating retroelement protein Avd, partial [Kovacikia sp.]
GINRFWRGGKFLLGDRMIAGLYTLLENLLIARYEHNKLSRLESLNSQLDVLRYQTRLMLDFELMSSERYQYVASLMNGIGSDLGGWIKHQKQQTSQPDNRPTQKAQPIACS